MNKMRKSGGEISPESFDTKMYEIWLFGIKKWLFLSLFLYFGNRSWRKIVMQHVKQRFWNKSEKNYLLTKSAWLYAFQDSCCTHPPNKQIGVRHIFIRQVGRYRLRWPNFYLIVKTSTNIAFYYESSTASLMRIFFLILKETLSESWLVWSPRSVIFKFGPWIMSIFKFSMSWKKRTGHTHGKDCIVYSSHFHRQQNVAKEKLTVWHDKSLLLVWNPMVNYVLSEQVCISKWRRFHA